MKQYKIQILGLLSLLSILGCQGVIFLPIQGEIDGYVTDNNGKPIVGVTVSAAFLAASSGGESIPRNRSTTTDQEGYFRLSELWDEVEISINHSGFKRQSRFIDLQDNSKPELNLELEGSPSIQAITLSKDSLSLNLSTPDTIMAKMEILDAFNSQSGNYKGNLILQNSAGEAQSIFANTKQSGGQNLFLLETLITTEGLPPGTYSLLAEATDPDGNTHQLVVDEVIQVE